MSSSAAGATSALYDRIGIGYRQVRRPDPRLAELIHRALRRARTVVDVGAGAGSCEPTHAEVTAVDPSQVMLDQHPGPKKVLAEAEQLPFEDNAFDAALAVMTVHHWNDLRGGLRELRRVSRRQTVFTWDPEHQPEQDGFRIAYWRRPGHFLDAAVRRASSTFAQLPPSVVEPAMAGLRADLRSGAWQRRHAALPEKEHMDYGYRLVVAGDEEPGAA